MKILLAATLLLLPLAPQEPKTLTVVTADGQTERVQVRSIEGDTAKLTVLVLGGSMQVTRKLDEFTPDSAFRIEEAATNADTFDAHFALAKKAASAGLLSPAGAHGRAAIELVKGTPDEATKTSEVRTWAADALEKMMRDAVAEGDLRSAKQYLKLLSTRLADQRSEEQLDALAAEVEGLDAELESKAASERQARIDSKLRDEIEKRFKPIGQKVAEGDKLQREAIKKSRTTTQSANLAERSIEAYKAAWKATEAVQKKYPDDADVAREASAIAAHLHDNAIRSALHAANMLTVQSDYKGAMDWCSKILAFDPENAEAKDMMRTIQVASAAASSQWGWGWRVVGGPGDNRRQR